MDNTQIMNGSKRTRERTIRMKFNRITLEKKHIRHPENHIAILYTGILKDLSAHKHCIYTDISKQFYTAIRKQCVFFFIHWKFVWVWWLECIFAILFDFIFHLWFTKIWCYDDVLQCFKD